MRTFLIALTTLALAAWSQSEEDQGAVDLNPLVVLSKSPGRYEKLTGTATRLDSAALARMRPTGTQEALERMPGVQGFADDGFGNSRLSIGIRGLSPRRSSRVLILEDGIPIAPAVYIYPNMYYNPPAERIGEIELIKGAASIEYGPQTMGGVVNYITRQPRREFGGVAQVTGGENGYGSVYTEIGGWGTKTLHPEVQLLYKRGDGFRDNNAFLQYNGTFKLNWVATPRDRIYLKFNADYEDAEATYTGLTEYSFRNDPNFNPKDNDQFTIRRYALDVAHTRDMGFGTRVTKVYGSVFLRDWWRENDIYVTPQNWKDVQAGTDTLKPRDPAQISTFENLVRVGGDKSNYGNIREFYTLGADNSWELYHRLLGQPGTLTLGARAHWERFLDGKKVGYDPDRHAGSYTAADTIIDTVVVVNEPTTYDTSVVHRAIGLKQHYETIALSLYAAEELRVGKLTIRPGVRLEVFEQERIDLLNGSRYTDHSEYVILPGVGVNYALSDDLNLFGGIHRGYTPPSTSTLQVLNFGEGSGSLDLKSEKSWNSELGARFSNRWAAAELCGYHMYVQDMVAPATRTSFKNLGAVRTYGLEASGSLAASRLNRFLPDAHLAYTWLASEVVRARVLPSQRPNDTVPVDIAGNRVPYAPEHTLVFGLSRDLPFGLSVGADAKFVSWVYTDYENIEDTENRGDVGPVDGYVVYDANASYRRGRFTVFANAKNLLDNIYVSSRLHSSPYTKEANTTGLLVGPRRQINVGTSYSF